jgi:MinD-like ATPase involved in chromosome partitioning or flagellar assembly
MSDQSRRAQQRLMEQLQQLSGDADVVLVDTGSGVTPWTRRFWRRASLVLVVTTADPPAVMDSYATIKLAGAHQIDTEILCLVNRCHDPARTAEACQRLSAACQRFLARTVPAAPSLPLHAKPDDAAAVAPRVWESPDSPFGHAVLWLGRAVADTLSKQSQLPLAA